MLNIKKQVDKKKEEPNRRESERRNKCDANPSMQKKGGDMVLKGARWERMGVMTEQAHIPIASTGRLLLIVIEIASRKEMAKDKFRNINTMFGMLHHRNTVTVIPYWNGAFLLVHGDVDAVHFVIALLVVSCIHHDLIKDLVKTRNLYLYTLFTVASIRLDGYLG